MRVKSFSVLMAAAVAFLIMGLSVSPLQASQYLGEVTWNCTDSLGHDFTMKAGLSRVGGSYYEIQGQAAMIPGDPPPIFAGGGVLVGTNLILTQTMTQMESKDDGYNNAIVMRVTIAQPTFTGTFWMVNHGGYDLTSGQFVGPTYTTGTLTCTSTPFPLAPNSQAVTSLMLLN